MLHRIPGGVSRLGTAAALNAGTAPFNAVQLDSGGKLPPIDGSQLTGIASAAGLTGFRNRIINGDFRVDQYSAGAGVNVGTNTSGYAIDRWLCSSLGGSGNFKRKTVLGGFTVTGATGVTGLVVQQRIESLSIQDLAGQQVMLAVDMSNSLLTTVNWSVSYPNASDNYASVTTIASGSWAVGPSTQRLTELITLPSNAANGVQVIFSVGAQTSGTWEINNAQLEAGTVATTFEQRPYGIEMILCMRYFEKLLTTLYSSLSSTPYVTWHFCVRKRVAPTVSGISATAGTVTLQGVDTDFAQGFGSTSAFAYWHSSSTAAAEL
jgi:hypothetical protein